MSSSLLIELVERCGLLSRLIINYGPTYIRGAFHRKDHVANCAMVNCALVFVLANIHGAHMILTQQLDLCHHN